MPEEEHMARNSQNFGPPGKKGMDLSEKIFLLGTCQSNYDNNRVLGFISGYFATPDLKHSRE